MLECPEHSNSRRGVILLYDPSCVESHGGRGHMASAIRKSLQRMLVLCMKTPFIQSRASEWTVIQVQGGVCHPHEFNQGDLPQLCSEAHYQVSLDFVTLTINIKNCS